MLILAVAAALVALLYVAISGARFAVAGTEVVMHHPETHEAIDLDRGRSQS